MDSTSDPAYWDFGFEEMSMYDLPTTISYILRLTQRSNLTIIGFSQGTTITFTSLILNKELLKGKVKAFIALAPVITMKNST